MSDQVSEQGCCVPSVVCHGLYLSEYRSPTCPVHQERVYISCIKELQAASKTQCTICHRPLQLGQTRQTQANDDEDLDYDIAHPPPVGTVLLSPPLNPPDPLPVEEPGHIGPAGSPVTMATTPHDYRSKLVTGVTVHIDANTFTFCNV